MGLDMWLKTGADRALPDAESSHRPHGQTTLDAFEIR
jgi:hypothetical protein